MCVEMTRGIEENRRKLGNLTADIENVSVDVNPKKCL